MMSLIVAELYDALVEAGASPGRAKAAAGAMPSSDHMATKEDLAGLEAKLEARMATKEDLAKLEARLEAKMATREDLAKLEARMATREDLAGLDARLEARMAAMATKADFARLDRQVAIIRFAIFGLGPPILALLVKLTFFP